MQIEGSDLRINWSYSDYCRASSAESMEFSIDSEAGTRFEELDCVAFDLQKDPDKRHPIKPLLLGADGISKKIRVPFLEARKRNDPFSVLLECTLPRCLKPGFGYYCSTLSFAQSVVARNVVELTFVGKPPSWVRVYEAVQGGAARLIKSFATADQTGDRYRFVDIVENRRGQSARVYAFWRIRSRQAFDLDAGRLNGGSVARTSRRSTISAVVWAENRRLLHRRRVVSAFHSS